MFRSLTPALFGLAAVVVMLGGRPGSVRADHHKEHFMECSKVCADCMKHCEMNFHHCFKMVESGKKEHARAAHLSADCESFCTLAAKLTARQSELAFPACEACAKACDVCAAECEKFPDDKEMQACAKSCRECAKACREMLKHAHHK